MDRMSIKEESRASNSVEEAFDELCRDLNLDEEIRRESLGNYQSLKKHYILEGNGLHWLAISLFVNCKKNQKQNPICLTRLFKNLPDFHLIEFFDKLHKWLDMLNLPGYLQNSIVSIENQFNISSIMFEKYSNLFEQLFLCSREKLLHFNSTRFKKDFQINQKYKQKKLNSFYLYQFIWTIYSLLRSLYPLTSDDLISSFHLLLASNVFIYQLTKKAKFFHLLRQTESSAVLIEQFCERNNCSYAMVNCIIEEHIAHLLLERSPPPEKDWDENQFFELIRHINQRYDEIVLTNCFIDQRIFLEKSAELNDFLNPLNENKNQKQIQNKTPLTAQQHLTFFNSTATSEHLTPISQANQLIHLLNLLVERQANLLEFVQQQTYLDDLHKRLTDYEEIFLREFPSDANSDFSYQLNQSRFQFASKLFFVTLQNIFIIQKKMFLHNHLTPPQISQSFQKLILTNDFIKSLLGLCLLLVLYSYGDFVHDLNWILTIYSLNGYSLLKIIQIFLKSTKEINQSRVFIKYLSTIEETILSSMIFEKSSLLWNDIQSKGILSYHTLAGKPITPSPSSPHSHLFSSSPISTPTKRKLFHNDDDDEEENQGKFPRSQPLKSSPYTMFYKKFYTLVYRRIHAIAIRLAPSTDFAFELPVWNLFLYLFEHHIEALFRSRHLDQIILLSFFYSFNSPLLSSPSPAPLTWPHLIHVYRSMPNSTLNVTRSVFIRPASSSSSFLSPSDVRADPCLTPSKPAGTIHLIDNCIYGDITSFYREIFLKIEDIEEKIAGHFRTTAPVALPSKLLLNENGKHSLSISCGKNLFVDYSSSSQIRKNLFHVATEKSAEEKHKARSTNILSSSVPAGSNTTVQTTTQRTSDGKFLTTISTSYHLNQQQHHHQEDNGKGKGGNERKFGQTLERTLSDQFNFNSNSNALKSLTKKVLQIENDRQATLPN